MMQLVKNLLHPHLKVDLEIKRWTITPDLVDMFDDDDLCIEVDESDVLRAAAVA